MLSRLLDKNLSIREHEEFKGRLDREITRWIEQFRIDVRRIEDQIKVLDQTKPTTGELERAAKAIDARLLVMESAIKTMNHLDTIKHG